MHSKLRGATALPRITKQLTDLSSIVNHSRCRLDGCPIILNVHRMRNVELEGDGEWKSNRDIVNTQNYIANRRKEEENMNGENRMKSDY